jgi:hypothetical protein
VVFFREVSIFLMKLLIGHKQGWIGFPNFGRIFFQGAPKTDADLKKKKVNKNYKVQMPLFKQKISTNQVELKLKKVMMVGGP